MSFSLFDKTLFCQANFYCPSLKIYNVEPLSFSATLFFSPSLSNCFGFLSFIVHIYQKVHTLSHSHICFEHLSQPFFLYLLVSTYIFFLLLSNIPPNLLPTLSLSLYQFDRDLSISLNSIFSAPSLLLSSTQLHLSTLILTQVSHTPPTKGLSLSLSFIY